MSKKSDQKGPAAGRQSLVSPAPAAASSIEPALAALSAGRLVMLIDDATSPPLSYLTADAAKISGETVALMAEAARGVVCAAISEARLRELGLAQMASRNSMNAPDFSVTVEARRGVTTGISSADRAVTLNVLATTKEARFDLVKPGHIFPLRAKQGGVLVRAAAAEGAVDLLDLAHSAAAAANLSSRPSPHVAALCHCLDQAGNLLPAADSSALAAKYKLPAVYLSQIIQRRLATETIIEKIASAQLPVETAGDFRAVCFRSQNDGAEHLALIRGEVDQTVCGSDQPVLVRVQAENRISDLLGTRGPGSRRRINQALDKIAQTGRGVLVYVRHPRQGLLRAQLAQQSQAEGGGAIEGLNNVLTSQIREIGIGSQILTALGIRRIELLTNSAWHAGSIAAFKLEVAGTVRLD